MSEIKFNKITLLADASTKNDNTVYFTSDTHEIYVNGDNYSGSGGDDKIDSDITTSTAIGNVPSGTKFAANTTVKSILGAILSYKKPTISIESVINSDNEVIKLDDAFVTTNYNLSSITYTTTNDSNINGTLTMTVNEAQISSLSRFGDTVSNTTTINSNTDLNGINITISGTDLYGNSISASFNKKYYIPVYTAIMDNCTNTPTSPTKDNTVHARTGETIVSNLVFTKGQYWCVYIPTDWNNITAVQIGTVDDYGFGTLISYSKVDDTIININNYNYYVYCKEINAAGTYSLKAKY